MSTEPLPSSPCAIPKLGQDKLFLFSKNKGAFFKLRGVGSTSKSLGHVPHSIHPFKGSPQKEVLQAIPKHNKNMRQRKLTRWTKLVPCCYHCWPAMDVVCPIAANVY
ncbi:hypothetical protein V8G54_030936 [Vigna mungo]|uniref:Uncharacterized protein n=1 Tax=Vigna mungo TaxID=3915 RepID=A0AAQ3RP19_VIGMU